MKIYRLKKGDKVILEGGKDRVLHAYNSYLEKAKAECRKYNWELLESGKGTHFSIITTRMEAVTYTVFVVTK